MTSLESPKFMRMLGVDSLTAAYRFNILYIGETRMDEMLHASPWCLRVNLVVRYDYVFLESLMSSTTNKIAKTTNLGVDIATKTSSFRQECVHFL